jgi:plastocyanin
MPSVAARWVERRRSTFFAVAVFCMTTARAGEFEVRVLAPDGAPVANAAVLLESAGSGPRRRERQNATMEQRDRHFLPELLVVGTGTLVDFPNNDTVRHQVYSFSPARPFQLSLYAGSAHPPIAFDKPGLVVLGCNIHDEMIGYILVTDSPYYAQTDARGSAQLGDVATGSYRLRIWAPRIADPATSLERPIEIGQRFASAEFRLKKALLGAPTPRPERGEWDPY